MASEQPRYLFRNFAVWLDKESYLGQASEVELPHPKWKTAEVLNAGMITAIAVKIAVEKQEAKVKLTAFDPQALALFGLRPGDIRQFMFTGAFVDEVDGTTHSAVITAWGFVHATKLDTWKVGDKNTDNEWELSLREWSLEIDGQPVLSISPFDLSRNGVSQTAPIRKALLV